jgi:peptide-N4-(N-acetyl-beta-glucosaminyl)asparagine amidase
MLTSTSGWNRKLAYCIAFSMDGATDVTRRYVRKPAQHGLGRTRCPEEVLLWIMHEIRKLRRENMDKEVRSRLMREDEREERELRGYIALSVTSDMMNSLSGTIGGESRGDEVKTPAERQQEAAATGVAWMGQPSPDMRPNGR